MNCFETASACVYCMDGIARVTRERKDFSKLAKSALEFLAVKNETESVQIILTAKKDVEYFAVAGDLVNQNGDVISAENFTFYYEKYILVDRNWQKNGYPIGYYPDALIPFSAPVLHGENIVKAGENGAVWVDLKIPKTQPCGVYTGKITVNAEGTVELPVRVEVLDVTLPDQITMKSFFSNNLGHMEHFEGEMTEALCDRYTDYLLSERVCPSGVVAYDSAELDKNDEAAYYRWLDKHIQAIDKGSSLLAIPARVVKTPEEEIFDDEDLAIRLRIIKERSLEQNRNLFAYAVFYDWLIDEPFCSIKYKPGKVERFVERFERVRAEMLKAWESDERLNSELGREIVRGVKELPHLITDYYTRVYPNHKRTFDKNCKPYVYDFEKVALCPRFDGFDTEEQRTQYEPQREKWWYGCNAPNAPYPSLHIDDVGYSARVQGWMMADYGVVGNLYWVTNFYQECNTTGRFLWLEDAYDTAHRGFGANGEGALLYPGKTYGVYGPIGCIRLKSFRDGEEEYELIKRLLSDYSSRGVDGRNVLRRLTAPVYNGSRLDAYGEYFTKARESFVRLLELSEKIGFTLDVAEEGNGWRCTAQASEEFSLTADGERVATGTSGRFFLKKMSDYVRLCVTTQAGQTELKLFLGDGLEVLIHEELYEWNAVGGKFSEKRLHTDDIRRSIKLKPTEDKPVITIDVFRDLGEYVQCDFLLRSRGEADYAVYSERGEKVGQGRLAVSWNRIRLDASKLSGSKLELRLEERVNVELGEVYLLK